MSQNGTTIFNILDNVYIIGEIFSSDRATLYKNPSDQTVRNNLMKTIKRKKTIAKLFGDFRG